MEKIEINDDLETKTEPLEKEFDKSLKMEGYWISLSKAIEYRDFDYMWRKMWAMYYLLHPKKAKEREKREQEYFNSKKDKEKGDSF